LAAYGGDKPAGARADSWEETRHLGHVRAGEPKPARIVPRTCTVARPLGASTTKQSAGIVTATPGISVGPTWQPPSGPIRSTTAWADAADGKSSQTVSAMRTASAPQLQRMKTSCSKMSWPTVS